MSEGNDTEFPLEEKGHIVKPSENYKGMSYADWIAIWENYIHSAYPEYRHPSDMLFLRGFIGYDPEQANVIQNIYEYDYKPKKTATKEPKTDVQRATERRPIYNRMQLKNGSELR